MRMLVAMIGLALFACKPRKEADGLSPAHVCNWFIGNRMVGSPWRLMVGDEWRCVGSYNFLPDGSFMKFVATGAATTVREVHVEWSEHVAWSEKVREEWKAAEEEFVDACETLNRKATGMSMASSLRKAIERRESGRSQQNRMELSVEADKMLSGAPTRWVKCKVRFK